MILNLHDPYISHSVVYANIFSVLDINENTLPWIFDNCMKVFSSFSIAGPLAEYGIYSFTNLFFAGASSYIEMFQNCPFIKNNIYDLVALHRYETDTIRILKDFIDSKGYILANVNMKCIEKYHTVNELVHAMFIYGYDDKSKQFYVADFFGADGPKYQRTLVPFRQVAKGIEKATLIVDPVGDYIRGIQVWHKQDMPYNIYYGQPDTTYTKNMIKNNINWLLTNHEQIHSYNTGFEIATGVYVYKQVMQSLQYAYVENIQYDFKPLDCLMAHKKIMNLAISFLIQEQLCDHTFLTTYDKIFSLCEEARNMTIKCRLVPVAKREELMKRIFDKLEQCKALEIDVLHAIADSL